MTHHADPDFWRDFYDLPANIEQLARANFELLKRDPRHRSLHFKRVGKYWTVRIGRNYRAAGIDSPDGIVWIWIGPHDEYDRLFS